MDTHESKLLSESKGPDSRLLEMMKDLERQISDKEDPLVLSSPDYQIVLPVLPNHGIHPQRWMEEGIIIHIRLCHLLTKLKCLPTLSSLK